MGYAVLHSRALSGLGAPPVQVEVHLAPGLPQFSVVGLADTEVREARERVRAALLQAGLPFPHQHRITVSLAPADLPKASGRFDLPMALGLLSAQGHLPTAALAGWGFAGELSLSGELRPIRGALALGLAAQAEPPARAWVLPPGSASEAAWVPGLAVHEADHLRTVVDALLALHRGQPAPAGWRRPTPVPASVPAEPLDLRDIRGQTGAKRALEVVAAGGHSLLLVGPAGSGKSMLAQRLPGLLPPLPLAQALATAALHGLRAPLTPAALGALLGQRPFRSPHHGASAAALVGGGTPLQPGEISLAHHGVLFLDELPEFQRPALEALREPLETGHIHLARAGQQLRLPCAFQLVAAMNPCPCGWLGSQGPQAKACECTPERVARYQSRLSGPLLDRIDVHVEVPHAPPQALLFGGDGDRSAAVAQRVQAAQQRQLQRQGCLNHALPADALLERCALTAAGTALMAEAALKGAWSGRALHRMLRVARSVADLDGAATVADRHLREAIRFRRGVGGQALSRAPAPGGGGPSPRPSHSDGPSRPADPPQSCPH